MKTLKLIGISIALLIWLIPELVIMFITNEPSKMWIFIYDTYVELLKTKNNLKVILLKKIRKRYTITHYPNGIYIGEDFYKGPLTILDDKQKSWRLKTSNLPKNIAYENLYQNMMHWIGQDYGPFNSKTRKITSEKLWYKK